MELASFAEIMAVLGPQNTQIERVDQVEANCWEITFTGKAVLTIDWIPSPARLVISASVGQASAKRRADVYESLLVFNSLWRDNDGVRLALSGANGQVQLIFEMHAQDITSAQLDAVLTSFIELAALWSAYVTSEATALPPPFTEMLLTRFA